jgi:hypothetical protein
MIPLMTIILKSSLSLKTSETTGSLSVGNMALPNANDISWRTRCSMHEEWGDCIIYDLESWWIITFWRSRAFLKNSKDSTISDMASTKPTDTTKFRGNWLCLLMSLTVFIVRQLMDWVFNFLQLRTKMLKVAIGLSTQGHIEHTSYHASVKRIGKVLRILLSISSNGMNPCPPQYVDVLV